MKTTISGRFLWRSHFIVRCCCCLYRVMASGRSVGQGFQEWTGKSPPPSFYDYLFSYFHYFYVYCAAYESHSLHRARMSLNRFRFALKTFVFRSLAVRFDHFHRLDCNYRQHGRFIRQKLELTFFGHIVSVFARIEIEKVLQFSRLSGDSAEPKHIKSDRNGLR